MQSFHILDTDWTCVSMLNFRLTFQLLQTVKQNFCLTSQWHPSNEDNYFESNGAIYNAFWVILLDNRSYVYVSDYVYVACFVCVLLMETKSKILAHCSLWHHITWSTLVQAMAGCLGAWSQYLNQCWLSEVVKLSYCIYLMPFSLKMLKMSIFDMSSKMTNLTLQLYVPEANNLTETWPCTVFTESKRVLLMPTLSSLAAPEVVIMTTSDAPVMTRMESCWQLSGFSYLCWKWLIVNNTSCSWWRHQMETFFASLAFVRGIHRGLVNSPHKGQWHGALVFSLICAWTNSWVNNHEAGDLRRYCAHYDITVMVVKYSLKITQFVIQIIVYKFSFLQQN